MKGTIIQVISGLIVAAWALPAICTTYIEPDEIGVRRSVFGGVDKEDFGQGRALALPIIHSWYSIPKTLHYQDFLRGEALNLRTKENNLIDIDVTVIYEVIPGEGHLIVEEGFIDTYDDKVRSVSLGFLREHLAGMTNADVQLPETREKFANAAVEPLNAQVRQYHVRVIENGVVLRAIRFTPKYEAKLQAKQLYGVQARLDEAKAKESEARTLTDTDEKGIDKDVKIETERWNQTIEKAKTKFEIAIANTRAEALQYSEARRAEADALCTQAKAEADLAEAKADALGKELTAAALATQAGQTYSAIEAVQAFKLGEIELNSMDPEFLLRFGSMDSWRRFFMGKAAQ